MNHNTNQHNMQHTKISKCPTYCYSIIDEPVENPVYVVNTTTGGDSQYSIASQARYPLPRSSSLEI